MDNLILIVRVMFLFIHAVLTGLALNFLGNYMSLPVNIMLVLACIIGILIVFILFLYHVSAIIKLFKPKQ